MRNALEDPRNKNDETNPISAAAYRIQMTSTPSSEPDSLLSNFPQVFPPRVRQMDYGDPVCPSFAGMWRIPTKKPKMSEYPAIRSGYTVI